MMVKLVLFWFGSCLLRLCSSSCSSTVCPPQDTSQESGKQSPVDIVTGKAEDTELPPLRFTNHWEQDHEVLMFQVGNTVSFKPKGNYSLSLEGGPLTGEFVLDQLHFHWGTDLNDGSEHSIDGVKYAMEAHAIYYNIVYGSAQESINRPDGITILACLMESKAIYHNGLLDTIVNSLNKLEKAGAVKTVSLTKNVFRILKESFEPQEYYTYEGSLTTPPFSEQVVWIVFKKFINIHISQVDPFRNVSNDHGKITCNVRSIQPLNGRTIYDVSPSCPCPDEVCKKKTKKLKLLEIKH